MSFRIPYVQHGRRHARNGSDPIPAGETWAEAYSSSIVTVSAGTSKVVEMISTPNYISDSSVFGIGTWVHSAVTYHGLRALQDGHYLARGSVSIGGFESATSGYIHAYWLNQPGGPAGYGSGGALLNCPIAVAFGQWDPFIETISTVSGGSTDIWIMEVNNTTSVDVTAFIDMIAVQMDTDTTYIF